MLSQIDPELYAVVAQTRLEFWLEPKGPICTKARCGVSSQFVAWKEHGVIACVVYTHFMTRIGYEKPIRRLNQSQIRRADRVIHSTVRSWLEEHAFPKELAACFLDHVPEI
jgi:hypothetical protein